MQWNTGRAKDRLGDLLVDANVAINADRERAHDNAPANGVLSVRDDRDNSLRLRAGRAWQRLHLSITARGLAAQPLNQVHERVDRERQLDITPTFERGLAGLVDAHNSGVFTFRIGTPTTTALASPRRPGSAVSKAS